MANRVISTDLWNDKKWAGIENIRTRYVWLYLLTCPLSNSCGVFKLPLKYVSADTTLNIDEIKRSIRELQDLRLCIYDSGCEEIAILRYPIYNLRHINDALVYMVANGLKQVKNHNLVKAVYLTLLKISDFKQKKDFEPIIELYKSYLDGKGVGMKATIGKENHIKKDKVKVESKGVGLGLENKKENTYQSIKENEDIDDESWNELLKEIGD